MPFCSFRKTIVASGVLSLVFPVLAEGQIVSRPAGGGLHVNAPYVNVNIPPIDVIAARGQAGGRRFFGRRRAAAQQAEQRANQRAKGQQQPGQQPQQFGQQPGGPVPDLAGPVASVTVAGPVVPTTPAPAMTVDEKIESLPTLEQLAKMDAAGLELILRDVSSQLHVRLANLSTGAGWQRYLKIPGALLDAPTQNAEVLQKTLAKYDAIAGNPKYAKLAGIPSFIATGATLRQLATFSDGPQIGNAAVARAVPAKKAVDTVEEILPTPAEPQQPDATRGERSILKRASR